MVPNITLLLFSSTVGAPEAFTIETHALRQCPMYIAFAVKHVYEKIMLTEIKTHS